MQRTHSRSLKKKTKEGLSIAVTRVRRLTCLDSKIPPPTKHTRDLTGSPGELVPQAQRYQHFNPPYLLGRMMLDQNVEYV